MIDKLIFIFSPIDIFAFNINYRILICNTALVNVDFVFSLFLIVYISFFLWIFFELKIIFNYIEYIFQTIFNFLIDLFKIQIKSIRSMNIFPILLMIFILIFFLNFSSLISFNLALTGHALFTFYFAFSLFFFFVIIAFLNYQLNFFLFFVPSNVPILLQFFLTFIEIISFLIRPFSLAIRLFANMLAGHTLLHIFANFYIYILFKYVILLLLPILICSSIILLEIGVSLIQTYVFFILLCVYLNDCYTLH